MESDLIYNNETFELTDDFIDVGYMAENIEVEDLNSEVFEIKRSHSDGAMTLLISFPNNDEIFMDELLKIDEFLNHIQVPIYCYFLFSKNFEQLDLLNSKVKKFQIVVDNDEEFGNMYGTKIVSGSLEDLLTKSLFLISKDGAIFYLEMPQNLETPLNLERLQVELNKAYVTYTGVGCHG
jgi:peroxiredoxin